MDLGATVSQGRPSTVVFLPDALREPLSAWLATAGLSLVQNRDEFVLRIVPADRPTPPPVSPRRLVLFPGQPEMLVDWLRVDAPFWDRIIAVLAEHLGEPWVTHGSPERLEVAVPPWLEGLLREFLGRHGATLARVADDEESGLLAIVPTSHAEREE